MKVFISPNPTEIDDANGVGKVVHAQFKYLPQFGIELVEHPENADVVACHVFGDYLPRLDVLHLHGLYFDADPVGSFGFDHKDANGRIAKSLRSARAVTMPSRWAGECLRRDMRVEPVTIHNGVDTELWQVPTPGKTANYVLWNKNRAGDVCDPAPAYELARHGIPVVSTFGPNGVLERDYPDSFEVCGKVPFARMVGFIKHATVYLATTKEVFSLSVLEAMAAGVPILGYDWGGTSEAVRHGIEGYLAKPGNVEGLALGYQWLLENRDEVSRACIARAKEFEWPSLIARYADLYRKVYQERLAEQHRVAVVIPNYNYARYVAMAISSALGQIRKPDEIIVVDDGSTDNSLSILTELSNMDSTIKVIQQKNLGVAAARNKGIAATNCEYIVCLDADDELEPTYIERLLPALVEDRSLGVVWSKLAHINESGTPTGTVWDFDFSWEAQAHPDPDTGGISNGIPSGAMFRRTMWERCGGYKQCYHPAEDAEFWLRGLSTGFNARRVTDEPLFLYRVHADSASNTRPVPLIHTWHPWSRDKQYPFAAPALFQPQVRSYSSPIVTVVIPVGPGHAHYLPTALESLLGQSFRDWEAVVVSDSKETSDFSEVADGLKPYPFARLAATPHPGGLGAGAARNRGLAEVRTPLVLWLDADDYLAPDALAQMVKTYVNNEGSKYVYTDWLAVGSDGTIEEREVVDYSQESWIEHGLHAVTVLMDTEKARAVGGFDEKLEGWEDWEFFIKCAYAGYCGVRLPEKLFAYRTATGQRREESQKQRDKLLKIFRTRYEGKEMARCCGGNGDNVLLAKGIMQSKTSPSQPENTTRLVFVGQQQAPVNFAGLAGRTYQAGNNSFDREVFAHPEDVPRLLATGSFAQA